MAVVDSALRVNRMEYLRVVDASIMLMVVSGNTNATAIMIAEMQRCGSASFKRSRCNLAARRAATMIAAVIECR